MQHFCNAIALQIKGANAAICLNDLYRKLYCTQTTVCCLSVPYRECYMWLVCGCMTEQVNDARQEKKVQKKRKRVDSSFFRINIHFSQVSLFFCTRAPPSEDDSLPHVAHITLYFLYYVPSVISKPTVVLTFKKSRNRCTPWL